MTVPARLGIVTLGVADLAWFRTADSHLGLFPWHELAEDARLPAGPRARFGGITLAISVDTPEDVAASLDAAVVVGATF